MNEKAGLAGDIAAIVNLSDQLVALCTEYSAADSKKPDITKLKSQVETLGTALKAIQSHVDGPDGQDLVVSKENLDVIDACTKKLFKLKVKLDANKDGNAMRLLGARAKKWPWKSKQVDDIISKLDRFEQVITVALQPDQSEILGTIVRGLDNVAHGTLDNASRIGCFSVPSQLSPDFINRPEILKWMTERHYAFVGRFALVGKPGLGKSQMAIHFAQKMQDISPKSSVFWVDGSSKPMFEHSYRALADSLELPQRHDPTANVLEIVRDWLQDEESGSWFMILDKVNEHVFYSEDGQSRLASFLPERRGSHLIVTSHSLSAAEQLTGNTKFIYEVEKMDDSQALTLFRRKMNGAQLQGTYDVNSAAKLVRALDHCPLAISLAAAFMIHRAPDVTVESYLDQFLAVYKQKDGLLRKKGDVEGETIPSSVAATWQITLWYIEQKEHSATRLLSLMSLFNPLNIPTLGLGRYMDEIGRKGNGKLKKDLNTLSALSLMSETESGDTYQMNPLVQTRTRLWLTESGKMKYWQGRFLDILSTGFPNSIGDGNRAICEALLPHAEGLFNEQPHDDDELRSWALLLRRCAWYFKDVGKGETALTLAKRALDRADEVWGRKHLGTQNLIESTALFMGQANRSQEEEDLSKELVALRAEHFGDEHPNTLSAKEALAHAYSRQGRIDEATELYETLIVKRKRIQGAEHFDTLACMRRLACVYHNNGQKQRALELFTLAEKTRSEPTTVQEERDLINLVVTHNSLGQHAEAEALVKPAVERMTRLRGHNDPNTMWATSVLASTYRHQKRYKEAIALAEWCLSLQEQVHGMEHPKTVYTRSILKDVRRV